MPYSDPSFDNKVKRFIKSHNYSNYLDIGPGAGKYGKIIKEIYPASFVEAVEINKAHVNKFNLKETYDKVYRADASVFFDSRPDYKTDVVIIGDSIEHLKKSAGIDLIHFLIYRSHYIIVVFPTKVIQYSWQGHSSEAHRSVWDKSDFKQFECKYYKRGFMNMVIVKGYLSDPTSRKVG